MGNAGRKRVSSGIGAFMQNCPSLDELMGGGVPQGSIVLLSGNSGSGKTLMALQFLLHGSNMGERGVYFSFDENRQDILDQAKGIGLDLAGPENDGSLILRVFKPPHDGAAMVAREMDETLKSYKPERIVVDSLSMYSLIMQVQENIRTLIGHDVKDTTVQLDKELVTRFSVIKLFHLIKESGATAFVTSERMDDPSFSIPDKVARFVADGVVYLDVSEDDDCSLIRVHEMRHTLHSHKTFNLMMTEDGMKVGGEI